MTDSFHTFKAIVPDDAVNFVEGLCEAIFVGGPGTVVVVGVDNLPVTFLGCPQGTILRVRAKRVNATLTTATNMVALYPKFLT